MIMSQLAMIGPMMESISDCVRGAPPPYLRVDHAAQLRFYQEHLKHGVLRCGQGQRDSDPSFSIPTDTAIAYTGSVQHEQTYAQLMANFGSVRVLLSL